MQPDFKTLKPVENQPDFGSLKPAEDVLDGFVSAQKTKTSFGQKVLNAGTAVTNFLGGKSVQETFGAEIAKLRATSEEKQFIDQPTLRQTAGSAIQLGATLLPAEGIASGITQGVRALGMKTGASALGKIGSGALIGEAFDIGTNLEQGKTGLDVVKPGVATALGGGIPAVGVAKNVAVRFGEAQAPRIINSLIKPLAKDFSYGKNPGRAVAEEGIVANNFDDLATKIRESRQKIGQSIGDLGRKLSTKPVVNIQDSLSGLDEAMKTAASQNNSTLLKRLADVKKSITSVLEPGVDEAGNIVINETGKKKLTGLTFSEARDILGDIGDITQFTGNPSDDKVVNSALKGIYGKIKEATLETADSVNPELAKQFRKLTEKYADLSSAEIATKYRDKIVERSNLVGLSPQMAGIGSGLLTMIATGGAATPAIIAGLSGAAIDKLASTPGFKTRLAALLSKKTVQETDELLTKVPALRKFFSKPKTIAPGDTFMQGNLGKKIKQEVVDYAKNPKLGMSIEDVTKSNPLLQEAKKYKSAEEFVKAQGEVSATQIKKEMGEYLGYNKNDTFIRKELPVSKLKNKNTLEDYGGAETQDGSEIVELMKSIRKNGFNTRVVVDETGKVLDGNHRIVAARELGIKNLPVYVKTKSQLTDIWNKANKK